MVEQKRSKEELEANVQIQRIQARTAITITAIRWAGLVGLAWCGVEIVDALAGRITLATIGIGIKVLGKVYISEAVAWLFAVSGVGYGLAERRLRHSNIARLSSAVRDRETALDPKRTSSRLTERGLTRPEDEV